MNVLKQIQSICRTCGYENDEFVSIRMLHTFGNVEVMICDALTKCAAVQVLENDDLPHQMCRKCCEALGAAYLFKKQCEDTDLRLRLKIAPFNKVIDDCKDLTVRIKVENSMQLPEMGDREETVRVKQESENFYPNDDFQCVSSVTAKVDDFKQEPEHSSYDELQRASPTVVKMEDEKMRADTVVPLGSTEYSDSFNGYGTHLGMIQGDSESDNCTQNVAAEKPYVCEICSKGFPGPRNLKQHMGTHVDEKPVSCGICGHMCPRKDELRRHMSSHTEEKPYRCDVCGFRSALKYNLKVHKMKHTGEKPFKCDLCDYRSVVKQNLKQHAMTHTGEKPLKCDVCDHRCITITDMKRHKITHTGDKPFTCDVCGYRCHTRMKLKRHRMTHTGEKPFVCEVCGYSCIERCSLKKHMMTHTGEKPFRCDVCDYGCTVKQVLKMHAMSHTGEKPFTCEECHLGFVSKQDLKRHMVTHTGEKPFGCDFCSYRCARKRDLVSHKRRH